LELRDRIPLPYKYRKAGSLCEVAASIRKNYDEELAEETLNKTFQLTTEFSDKAERAKTMIMRAEAQIR